VLEVEVERLPDEDAGEPAPPAGSGAGRRQLPPMVAGMLVDLLDVATMGLTGLYVGLPVGLAVGFYLGRRMGMSHRRSLGLGALCGVYCAIPATSPIPLGTLIGAYRAMGRS
jgi:hypothetical protein